MRHLTIILAAALGATLAALPLGAQTQPQTQTQTRAPEVAGQVVPETAVWIQLAARRTRPEAEALAVGVATGPLAGLGAPVVMATPSGWFAVALGPFPGSEAEDLRAALLRERLVPADSFLVAVGVMPPQTQQATAGAAAAPPRRVPRPPASPLVGTVEGIAAGTATGDVAAAGPLRASAPPRQGIGIVADTGGGIVAPAAVALGCARIETETGQTLRIVVGDAPAGFAYLRPQSPEMPPDVPAGAGPSAPLTLRAAPATAPLPGQAGASPALARVTAYPGRLAPMLTLPVTVQHETAGATGSGPGAAALWVRLEAQAADAGAPLWDPEGALVGVVLAPEAAVPGSWALAQARPAAEVLAWLDQAAGVRAAPSIEGGPPGIAAAEAATLRLYCLP